MAAFAAGFGVSPEEASKSHRKGFNNVSTQQIIYNSPVPVLRVRPSPDTIDRFLRPNFEPSQS